MGRGLLTGQVGGGSDDKKLPLAGGIMSGSISFEGEFNKGDWASCVGAVDQPIDDTGSANSVISGSVDGQRLYSLEMLNNTGSPTMRLYAGTNYLEINDSNITTNGVIFNAAWNDYAEYFQADRQYTAGQVVRATDHGLVTMSTGRLQRACHIVSGTYGMVLGDEKNGVPVALAGRVLAYVDKANVKTGDAVCSGKEGTVSRMRWYERILFPDRMIGIVHYVPTSDKWNNYDALGRVVISVK